MKKPQLEVQKRKVQGKQVKKLRAENILPANIYGKKIKSTAVQVDLKAFKAVYQEVGETGVVEIKVSGESKTRPGLIHNVQLDPVTDLPLHADFRQISLTEKTTVEVPVELVGEAPAEKSGVGILMTILDNLEVEALPADLPEKIIVNVDQLEKVDDMVRVKDIDVDQRKIKILTAANEVVARIAPPEKEEAVVQPQPEAKETLAAPEGVAADAGEKKAQPKAEEAKKEEKGKQSSPAEKEAAAKK